MTNSKLPAYFEKYLEGKFAEVAEQIGELKNHVNDEISSLKKWVITLSVVTISLLILHVDEFGVGFLISLKKLIGI